MTYTNIHTVAPSGRTVFARVTRLDYGRKSWRAEAGVNCATLSTGHYATRKEAETNAQRMHDSYMTVHSSPATVAHFKGIAVA